ncbi:hypothetical protein [Paenibacillus sp. OAE614]|uniref:hypothetical protein n=1 Tax=Paenibacillus sp. OAE614 TaxID=2663804 RepID=UPI0017895930
MKKKPLLLISLITILLLLCSGCNTDNASNKEAIDSSPRALQTFYPGDITKVDAIKIVSGSDGIPKTISDPTQIKNWIEHIRHLTVVPDINPQDSSGVLFHVTLLEQKQEKLNVTPTNIDHTPIRPNTQLAELMKELYGNAD